MKLSAIWQKYVKINFPHDCKLLQRNLFEFDDGFRRELFVTLVADIFLMTSMDDAKSFFVRVPVNFAKYELVRKLSTKVFTKKIFIFKNY